MVVEVEIAAVSASDADSLLSVLSKNLYPKSLKKLKQLVVRFLLNFLACEYFKVDMLGTKAFIFYTLVHR